MVVRNEVYLSLKTIQEFCNQHQDCDDCSVSPFCLINLQKEFPCDWDLKELLKNKEEDTEEQGRLVILPCKIGDTVWSRDVEPWTVISVEWFSRKAAQLHCKSPVTGRRMTFSIGKHSLGKTVFPTREEAEAALNGGA